MTDHDDEEDFPDPPTGGGGIVAVGMLLLLLLAGVVGIALVIALATGAAAPANVMARWTGLDSGHILLGLWALPLGGAAALQVGRLVGMVERVRYELMLERQRRQADSDAIEELLDRGLDGEAHADDDIGHKGPRLVPKTKRRNRA